MLKNYLKTAIRNFLNNKTYSIIIILGLAIGLASSIMVLLFLKNEMTYDQMHIHQKNIYRVGFKTTSPEDTDFSSVITAGVAPSLIEEFPEVEAAVRVRTPRNGYFTYQDVNYSASEILFADSAFFSMFSFKLVSGSAEAVLVDPYSIVLSKSLAYKIFGDQDPIGKVLNWNNAYAVIVKGLVEDCPKNSSIQYSSIISFSTLYDQANSSLGWNGGNQYYNFIKLHKKSSLETILPKLPDFLEKHINYLYRPGGWLIELVFDRLDQMRLNSTMDETAGIRLKQIFVVSLIGLFILLIAVFNFINLSTARSSKRSVEIGIRKVLGAHKQKIAIQFLSEAVLYALISFVVALILVEIFQPVFSRYIGDYKLYAESNIGFILSMVVFTVLVGLLAGTYPSIFIARFNPVKTLKGQLVSMGGKPFLRNTLVVIQFIISTAIISYTFVILMQMNHMQKMDMGFQSENILIVRMPSREVVKDYRIIKSHLEELPEITTVSAASNYVGGSITMNGYGVEGNENSKLYKFLAMDYDYFNMLGVKVVKGRSFSREFSTDASSYLVNEAMVREMNWKEPLGKIINRRGPYKVIGIVEDFHFEDVNKEIRPLIVGLSNETDNQLIFIGLSSDFTQTTIERIENKWRTVFPDEPFSFSIYNNILKMSYSGIRKSSYVFGVFAFLAILIACMGLYGLAIFTIEKRQREIGIRKVFGASTFIVAKLVILDFIKWIILANIISWPISIYFADRFTQDYPYAVKLGITPYLASFVLSLLIAFVTIVVQVIKLSNTNPTDTLKYE